MEITTSEIDVIDVVPLSSEDANGDADSPSSPSISNSISSSADEGLADATFPTFPPTTISSGLTSLTDPLDAISNSTSNFTSASDDGNNGGHHSKAMTTDDIFLTALAVALIFMMLGCSRSSIPPPELRRGEQIRQRAQENLQRRRQRRERRREEREARQKIKKDTPEQRKLWMRANMYETTIQKQEPNGYFYWTVQEVLDSFHLSNTLSRPSSAAYESKGGLDMNEDEDADMDIEQGGSHSQTSATARNNSNSNSNTDGRTASKLPLPPPTSSPFCVPILTNEMLNSDVEEESTCIICMEDFQVNDVVSWSYQNNKPCTRSRSKSKATSGSTATGAGSDIDASANANTTEESSPSWCCRHVFHVDCIQLWLCDQRQDDCPACRTELLVRNPHDSGKTVDVPHAKQLSGSIDVIHEAGTANDGTDGNSSAQPRAMHGRETALNTSSDTADTIFSDSGNDTDSDNDNDNDNENDNQSNSSTGSTDHDSDSDDDSASSRNSSTEDVFFIMGGLLVRRSCAMQSSAAATASMASPIHAKPVMRRSSFLQSALNMMPMSPMIPSIPLRRTFSQGTQQQQHGGRFNRRSSEVELQSRSSSLTVTPGAVRSGMAARSRSASMEMTNDVMSAISFNQASGLPPLPFQPPPFVDSAGDEDYTRRHEQQAHSQQPRRPSITASLMSVLSSPISMRRSQSEGIRRQSRTAPSSAYQQVLQDGDISEYEDEESLTMLVSSDADVEGGSAPLVT